MPFKSQAQRRYLYSQHPDVAEAFASETPKGTKLPQHVRRYANGGAVTVGGMPPAPPQALQPSPGGPMLPGVQPPQPPQPLRLPPVNYQPYKPNPRTTRSLVRRSVALQAPVSPFVPAAPGGAMPGFQAARMPAPPPPGLGGIPGFADGGDVYTGEWGPGAEVVGETEEERQAREAREALMAAQVQARAQGQETPGVTQPGTLLGALQQQRFNPQDPTAGNVAPDAAQRLAAAAATALPAVAFGPVATATGWGLQAGLENAGAPEPVAQAAALLPYTLGGAGELATQNAYRGIGGAAGQTLTGEAAPGLGRALAKGITEVGAGQAATQAYGQTGLPDPNLPLVGPASNLVGMVAGGMAFERAAQTQVARNIGESMTDLHMRMNPVRESLSRFVTEGETGAARIPGGGGRVEPGETPEPQRTARPRDVGMEDVRELEPGPEVEEGFGPWTNRYPSGQEYTAGPRTAFGGAGGGVPSLNTGVEAGFAGPGVGETQGPVAPTNLRLPGGEPIYTPPGQEPLRPALPAAGMTVSDRAALDAAVAEYRRNGGQINNLQDLLNMEEGPQQQLLLPRGPRPNEPTGWAPEERWSTQPEAAPRPGPTGWAPREAWEQPPEATPLTGAKLLSEADRLGVTVDRQVLERGTEYAKGLEQDRVQQAVVEAQRSEAEYQAAQANAPVQGPESIYDVMRREGQQQNEAARAAREARTEQATRAAEAPEEIAAAKVNPVEAEQRQAGGSAPQTPGAGIVKDRPYKGSILGTVGRYLNETGYFALAGDIGTVLRQDIMMAMNPLKAAETARVYASAARALGSDKTAGEIMGKLRNDLPRVKETGVKIEEADPHVTPGAAGESLKDRNLNRETYMSKATDWGPFRALNRANAMILNARRYLATEAMLEHNNVTSAEPGKAQAMANLVMRMTGRGDLGSKASALAQAGPLFTSLRNMTSYPQTFAQLIPYKSFGNGNYEIFGPVWREAVKAHAGWASGTLLTMGLAKAAGLDVGMDPRRMTDSEDGGPGFGHFRYGQTFHDLTGGRARMLAMGVQFAKGEKNMQPYPRFFAASPPLKLMVDGKEVGTAPGRMGGTVADYFRNSVGPGPGIAIEALKFSKLLEGSPGQKVLDYMHPDYWDKGPLQSGDWKDRVLSHLVYLWGQDLGDAIRANHAKGLISLPLSFFGSNAVTIQPGMQTMRGDILDSEAERMRAFKGNESQAEATAGAKYGELAPREQSAINSVRDPAQVKELEDKARSEGNLYQLAADARNQIRAQYDPVFANIQRRLDAAGDSNSVHALNEARNRVQTEMNQRIANVQVTGGSERDKNTIQQLVQVYNQTYNIQDFAAREKEQARVVRDTQKAYGDDVAKRLIWNVAPGVNEKAHPLNQAYSEARPLTSPYFAIKVQPKYDPKDPGQIARENYLIRNPQANVALSYLYGNTLRSPEAARLYQQQHPTAARNMTFDLGYSGTPVSYRNLERTGNRDLITYEALTKRNDSSASDFLRTHDDLNVMLWQTGHTNNIYSLSAYDKLMRSRR